MPCGAAGKHDAIAMNLKEILIEKKSAVVKSWFESVLETYQEESRGPLRRKDAQFTNPVGFNLAQGLEGLFDALLRGMMPNEVSTQLDAMIRIRAIQDFTPSQAVAFIFQIKGIVRHELGKDLLQDARILEELRGLETAVDDLALYAFDLYMRCREKIYELKAQESKNATFRLLQKARIITGGGEKDQDPKA
jgi:hypothetical protein